MKRLCTFILVLLMSVSVFSQTEKTVVVEHFTNTKCSICASRNPAFYELLNNYPNVLHIAYHPSSPYPGCIFSQYNPEENDARTNFYGIYGGTPRVVVQGEVIPPGSQLLTADQLESKLGMLSDYSIHIKHQHGSGDQIHVTVTVKRLNGSGAESLMFTGALVEKEVDYTAPNGEEMHPDVFRKFVLEEPVSLANPGDSVVFATSYTSDPVWIQDEISVLGMLQKTSDKSVLQAGQSGPAEAMAAINQATVREDRRLFSPNPVKDYITIRPEFREEITQVELYDLFGKKVKDIQVDGKTNLADLNRGYYFLVAHQKSGSRITARLLKQ